nr:allene oxide synthase-lipoxygenase protein [Biomphalaria glabrata]
MGCCFGTNYNDFVLRVTTGSQKNAGTDTSVYIILHDDFNHASGVIHLDNCLHDDFKRGRTDIFNVPTSKTESLHVQGNIIQIELWRERSTFDSDWYVNKIEIENRFRNTTYLFPVYRWIKANVHYVINQFDTCLAQEDHLTKQRSHELEEKKKTYEYDFISPGLPVKIKKFPQDEAFDSDTKWRIISKKVKLIVLSKILLSSAEWKTMEDLKNIYTKGKALYMPYNGKDLWSDDVFFGYQRISGINPLLIKLVTQIPPKFPVTNALTKPFLEGYVLDEALEQKKIFMCDLKILEGTQAQKGFVICHPMAMFFLDRTNHLKPVAIQLFQKPGPKNPIFTPASPFWTWTVVKMWYNNAEAIHHQILVHNGYHSLFEGIVIAVHRNLSPSHPIFKLLASHTVMLLAMNERGRNFIFCKGGWLEKALSISLEGFEELTKKGLNNWKIDVDGSLPDDLKRRGVDDHRVLPCYPYRDDAMLIYKAIKEFVQSYIELYYSTSNLLKKDCEIQNWAKELAAPRNKGGVAVLGSDNNRIESKVHLLQILTNIIFICSAGHTAVNSPQYDAMGFPSNYPGKLRGTPPTDPAQVITEKDVLNTLPDKRSTLSIMIITKILSGLKLSRLGEYTTQYIFDPEACQIVKKFQSDLLECSKEIEKRNQTREYSYEYLLPERITNSFT